MLSAQEINLFCLIILLAYWAISARSVKPTQEVKRSLWDFRIVMIVTAVILTILQHLHLLQIIPFVSFSLFPPSSILDAVSVFLSIGGVIVAIVARWTLGRNWSGQIDFKNGHTLITTGIYHYTMHPIYSGFIALLLGILLATRTLGVLFVLIFFTGFLIYKLFQEEELMIEHFPKEYAEYKEKTKRLIPFIW